MGQGSGGLGLKTKNNSTKLVIRYLSLEKFHCFPNFGGGGGGGGGVPEGSMFHMCPLAGWGAPLKSMSSQRWEGEGHPCQKKNPIQAWARARAEACCWKQDNVLQKSAELKARNTT